MSQVLRRPDPVAEVILVTLATLLVIRAVVVWGSGVLWDLPLALVPILFMWVPVWVMRARGEDPDRYPLAIPGWSEKEVWRTSVRLALIVTAVVAIPYAGLYHLWQTVLFPELLQGLCDLTAEGALCREARRAAVIEPDWRWPSEPLKLVGYHLFFVAIPEELFYRGYVQSRLDERWTPRWRILGATLGPGWLLTCVIFAFGHSVVSFQWWHFAIIFPSLVFGWLRARTGQVMAGAFFHAWCNVTVAFLDVAYGLVPP